MQELGRRLKRHLFGSSAVGNVLRKVAARADWEEGTRRDARRASPKTRRENFALEAMEPRVLLSATLDAAGLLTVTGTADNDEIVVALNSVTPTGGLSIDLTETV